MNKHYKNIWTKNTNNSWSPTNWKSIFHPAEPSVSHPSQNKKLHLDTNLGRGSRKMQPPKGHTRAADIFGRRGCMHRGVHGGLEEQVTAAHEKLAVDLVMAGYGSVTSWGWRNCRRRGSGRPDLVVVRIERLIRRGWQRAPATHADAWEMGLHLGWNEGLRVRS